MSDTKPEAALSFQFSFEHPILGELHGVRRSDSVAQFRGIPFADIPARFRQSILKTQLPRQPFDATQPGTICPQVTALPFPPMWNGPLGPDGIPLNAPDSDELKCLNLNITTPLSALSSSRHLPVLVHVHGGAFIAGSSSIQVAGREIADGFKLVEASIALGRPIVVVSINYRVGPLGFLASAELDAFNKSHGEPIGNYGLHDQRQGLEWVVRFIADFGGDPNNITIQGGSAGGASCHFQALFQANKVKRAILSSGTTLAIGAMPLSYHQKRFDAFVAKYAAATGDPVPDLQNVPVGDLVNSGLSSFYDPLIDHDWIKGRTATDLVHNPTDVDLMVGSCAYEQDVTLAMVGALGPNATDNEKIKGAIWNMLEPAGLTTRTSEILRAEVLEAYGLEEGDAERPSAKREVWAEVLADVVFRVPSLLLGRASVVAGTGKGKGRVWLYEFEATNPYPDWELGYGKANHALSDIFLFDPAVDMVPEEHREEYEGAVRMLQREWVGFCYGEVGWKPVRKLEGKDAVEALAAGPVYVFGNGGAGGERESMVEVVENAIIERWRALLDVAEM